MNKEISKFSDWINSFVPQKIKKTVNERVEKLKDKVENIFEKNKLYKKETALNGYLKTIRIDGQEGQDPNVFFKDIKPKVNNLINQEKKPI